jgi:hypothetical protein
MGRDVKYLWKRMEGSRDGLNKGFSGKHVERLSKRKQGNFIIFGKAAKKNESRARMIKQLKDTRSQRNKFAVYGSKAQGQSQADQALSICAGKDGKVMYDNAFLNVEKKFSVETLALFILGGVLSWGCGLIHGRYLLLLCF